MLRQPLELPAAPASPQHAPARPRPTSPLSATAPSTSRTSSPHDADDRTGPSSTTATASRTSPCRSARSAAGTTSSCPVNCGTSGPCRTPDGRRGSTVGPWTHTSVDGTVMREMLGFGLAHARGEQPPERCTGAAVRDGRGRLARLPVLAAAGLPTRRFHLQPGGALATDEPRRVHSGQLPLRPGRPDARGRWRAHVRGRQGGPRRQHEAGGPARTSSPTRPTVLDTDVEVVGEVSAEIWFRSSLPYADVFVRLCDVDEKGRSTNVCDGLVSLTGADELSPRTVRAVADGVPLPAWPPHPGPGVQRCLPALQPQPGHGRAEGDRHHPAAPRTSRCATTPSIRRR